jgi:putative ABC transport system permease protein
VTLLSANFTKLVLLAFVIAAPVTWFLMREFLQEYAYHVPLSPMVFVLTGVLALLIAWLTISYQSIKAALANPVKSLRNE